MRTKIGAPRRGQSANRAVMPKRTQGRPGCGRKVAVIDEQRSARLAGESGTERSRQGEGGGADLDDRTGRALAQRLGDKQARRRARGTTHKHEATLPIDPNHVFGPPARRPNELADWQRVEKFVGNQQHRAFRKILDAAHPRRLSIAEPALLFSTEDLTHFDEKNAQRTPKLGYAGS